MARLPKIRTNIGVPFPALVKGSGPITVTKVNGVWTVGYSIAGIFVQIPLPSAYATDYVLIWDSVANTFARVSLATLIAGINAQAPTFDFAPGDYNVTTETTLFINKAIPAAHNINLPTVASRNGIPIIIKDCVGNAASFVATIVPNGAERIDGLAALPINSNYGGFKLVPVTSLGGWSISP